jgi:hypothetical protein
MEHAGHLVFIIECMENPASLVPTAAETFSGTWFMNEVRFSVPPASQKASGAPLGAS